MDDYGSRQGDDDGSRQIVPWLLLFLYGVFLYTYGAKLSTLVYTDFPSFYYGARLSFIEKHSPYDATALSAAAERAEPTREGQVRRRIYPYLYPPPSLLMFYPLARLPVGAAKLAVLVINHVCLLLTLWLLLVCILGFSPGQVFRELLPAFLILYLLFFRGIDSTIELGQVNLLVLMLLCLSWLGIKRDWPAWAIAIPLAIASVFKLYPVLFLGMLVFRRKFWAAGLTVGILLAIAAASWLLLPRAFWTDWLTNVAPTCGYLRSPLGIMPPTLQGNLGVAGFMARLFLPPKLFMEVGQRSLGSALIPNAELGRMLTVGIIAGLVLITGAAVYISTRRDRGISPRREDAVLLQRGNHIDLEFAAILILTFLVAPLAWEHHLTYVAPAVVVAIMEVLARRQLPPQSFPGIPGREESSASPTPRHWRRWLDAPLLICACIIAWPLTVAKLPLPRLALILLTSLKLYAVLAMWCWFLARLIRGGVPIQSESSPADSARQADEVAARKDVPVSRSGH